MSSNAEERQGPSSRRNYVAVFLLVLLLTGILATVAALIYRASTPTSFGRRLAELLLQLALVGLVGAVITAGLKVLVDAFADTRARAEQDHQKRLEFLRRLRNAHISVAYAQRIIRAHDSAAAYTEELQKLMHVAAELEEISEDLQAARNIFSPNDATIVAGIEDIIRFLWEGAREYERFYTLGLDGRRRWPSPTTARWRSRRWSPIRIDLTAQTSICAVAAASDALPWLKEFIKSGSESEGTTTLPARYDDALRRSKRLMRQHVYSQSGAGDRREGLVDRYQESRDIWADYNKRQEFEHDLINRKTTWWLATQGILITAYGVSQRAGATASDGLSTVIAGTGLAVAVITVIGVLSVIRSKYLSHRSYADFYAVSGEIHMPRPLRGRRLQWGVKTSNTFVSLAPDVLLPIVFAIAWLSFLV